ncbi:MAG: recombinase family protein [Rhizobiaceae bacterium]|nr:recombinase family protein [Rhizobiaceae bacterium]
MAERSSSSSRQQRTVRCAIYTRKSSEEGLEQDFNSLHAQREACEAYIASQRHEGWKLLPARYDDGGYSGGSMERPGLQKLLADMQSGMIDVVVVYKVDRLTRSLTDFARIVEAFDSRNASFVSVTQSFNTTTSMGRLTLNVLLSFAQFEREVTGERIRDKIAASKKKGMWMGGFVPMGYAAHGRSLAIVESEAATIRRIFNRFLTLESVRDLKVELDRDGITTRPFVSASNNRSWGDRPFSIGHLRSILQNPIYVGEVRHKGERYPAQHPAIIDREQFDRVQALISSRARGHLMRVDAEHINLLAGLLFDQDRQKFTCAHTSKRGVRYRYYVAPASSTETKSPARISAGELENLVIDAVTAKLRDSHWLQADVLPPDTSPDTIADASDAARRAADRIGGTDAQTIRQQLTDLIKRIDILPDTISVILKTEVQPPGTADSDDSQLAARTIVVANPFTARSQSKHLVVRQDTIGSAPSKWLIKALARSITWYDDLVSGRAASFREIAEREGVAERYVAKLIPLAFLDPGIVEDSLDGRTALSLTASDLAFGVDLPPIWANQQS